jgi:hypothetical protein
MAKKLKEEVQDPEEIKDKVLSPEVVIEGLQKQLEEANLRIAELEEELEIKVSQAKSFQTKLAKAQKKNPSKVNIQHM